MRIEKYVDGKLISTEHNEDVNEIKARLIKDLNKYTYSKLEDTDWYIVRKMDTGEEVPLNVQLRREDVRNKKTRLEEQINDTDDLEYLESINVREW